ncbi:MAG: hypothetical protein GVY32_09955 [Gammaproteobacteria bacterium]|nr:hypothetical protein [Gammaproteobacteria bacterium]
MATPALAQTATARDAVTGRSIEATLTIAPAPAQLAAVESLVRARLDEAGDTRSLALGPATRLALEVPAAARVEAAGYRTLYTVLRPSADNRGWTFLLEPVDRPRSAPTEAGDRLLITGWVHDAASGRPLEGARISSDRGAAETRSDRNGAYSLTLPALRDGPDGRSVVTLRAEMPGYAPWSKRDLFPATGRASVPIALGAGPPASPSHRQLMGDPIWPSAEPGSRLAASTPLDRADQPPASVTVGFGDAACSVSCCTGQCGHSCVMPLETYVRRGIGDEWIASWAHDALAAGAVAYRSYGAWHVINPPAHGAYDLCSSACCQVNDPDTFPATDEAADVTAGLMLMRQQAVFRSEYSAQNNCLQGELSCVNPDLSCGDGFAGSPATGWPCLADPVGQGEACFGHGRGMSQWGNHFWTQETPARHWKWQLDHYYNDSGDGSGLRTAVISQVLSIESVALPPGPVVPGGTLTIDLTAANLAAEDHEHVLIGASLRRGSDPFVDDPANDRLVELASGVSATSRPFSLPPDLPAGDYALWLALWLDVDRDGAVTGVDLVQELVVIDAAVVVGGTVFRDRFEP